ncbi:transposase [Flectobacillus major]|jgi:REP element-mobilizing transposase RayT|uniref:transposase n=1 Tax=Flectobacillus major TaxID=103 RepID=UPI0005C44BDA|nr:transposase [Flectobacillus major]
MSNKKSRRSIRYKNHDYSAGGSYFITICSINREHIFGEIIDERIHLSYLGSIIEKEWLNIPSRFVSVELSTFQIMPNHLHAIIHINKNRIQDDKAALKFSKHTLLGNIIGSFKSLVFQTFYKYLKDNDLIQKQSAKIWQRNYWEHIIRFENELYKCQQYIVSNPEKWSKDADNLEKLLLRMEEKSAS